MQRDQACIPVPGPWVLVPANGQAQYLLSCPRTQRRRRPRRAGDLTGRPRRVGRPARRARPAGHDHDDLGALPCRLDGAQRADLPAAARLHPGAVRRRRPLHGLGPRRHSARRDAGRAAARLPCRRRRDRARRGQDRACLVPLGREARRVVAVDRVPGEEARRRSAAARSSTSRASSRASGWSRRR